MSPTRRLREAATRAVRGISVEVRMHGFTWKATVKHLGGGGTDYYRFNGWWRPVFQPDMPKDVYRKIRKEVRAAVEWQARAGACQEHEHEARLVRKEGK